MSSIYVRGGPPDPLSLQLFENNRFIVMSKMQRGVHGWFQRETGVVRGARTGGSAEFLSCAVLTLSTMIYNTPH
jgi:hypothetical protein